MQLHKPLILQCIVYSHQYRVSGMPIDEEQGSVVVGATLSFTCQQALVHVLDIARVWFYDARFRVVHIADGKYGKAGEKGVEYG